MNIPNGPVQISANRIKSLLYLILIMMGLAIARLTDWQIGPHADLRAAVGDEADKSDVRLARGMILDRNGLVLAMDYWGARISASPNVMGDEAQRRRVAEQLALILQKPPNLIWEKFANPTVAYVIIEHQASMVLGESIAARRLPGVTVEPMLLRNYPMGTLAAHTLGFVDASNRGVYGVEEKYQAYLTGANELCRPRAGVQPTRLQLGLRDLQPTQSACDLVLTIDWAIQDMVERELSAAIVRTRSASGTIIVVEPSSGKILAMASLPSYNPNKFYEASDAAFNHPAITMDYEPGSVIKIMTVAAGIDSGAFTPNSTLYDSGEIIVGGRKILNWDKRGHGQISMTDVLAKSLNVGSAYISTSLGQQRFYEYLQRFGFAKRTEVDIANEVNGQVRLPDNATWSISDLGTNSFGQGMTATPLQVTMMASAVANGGVMMKPYVVETVVARGQAQTTKPQPTRRVIASDTARALSKMLADAIEQEASSADLPGIRVAGKTGTADIPNPRTGKYDLPYTIASFVGWAPHDDPKFVMLVKLDKPQTSIYGSVVAAPVFRDVMKKLLPLLDVPTKVVSR